MQESKPEDMFLNVQIPECRNEHETVAVVHMKPGQLEELDTRTELPHSFLICDPGH